MFSTVAAIVLYLCVVNVVILAVVLHKYYFCPPEGGKSFVRLGVHFLHSEVLYLDTAGHPETSLNLNSVSLFIRCFSVRRCSDLYFFLMHVLMTAISSSPLKYLPYLGF